MNEEQLKAVLALCMGVATAALLYAWYVHTQWMNQYETIDSRLQRLEKEVLDVEPDDTRRTS